MMQKYHNEMRSKQSDYSVNLHFQNNTGFPIKFDWIDFEGKRVNYGQVESNGNSCDQQTYVTHPWYLYMDQGHQGYDLGVYVPLNLSPNSDIFIRINSDYNGNMNCEIEENESGN